MNPFEPHITKLSLLKWEPVHPAYHFLDYFPQSSSLDVLCDKVQSLVFVEDSNELEHVGVIQTTYHLHLRTFEHVWSHSLWNKSAPKLFRHHDSEPAKLYIRTLGNDYNNDFADTTIKISFHNQTWLILNIFLNGKPHALVMTQYDWTSHRNRSVPNVYYSIARLTWCNWHYTPLTIGNTFWVGTHKFVNICTVKASGLTEKYANEKSWMVLQESKNIKYMQHVQLYVWICVNLHVW